MRKEEFLDRIDGIMCGTSNAERAYLADLYDEVNKPHWISVEDELPPIRNEDGMSDIVLTHSKRGVIYMNRYDYRGNAWGNPLAFNVTHWMPLPEAPEGGEQ